MGKAWDTIFTQKCIGRSQVSSCWMGGRGLGDLGLDQDSWDCGTEDESSGDEGYCSDKGNGGKVGRQGFKGDGFARGCKVAMGRPLVRWKLD